MNRNCHFYSDSARREGGGIVKLKIPTWGDMDISGMLQFSHGIST